MKPSKVASDLKAGDSWAIDFRYAPPWWQTSICLPDDWQKTLVGREGALLYDYPGKYAGFGTRISFGTEGESGWVHQELVSPRVPIVRTLKRAGTLEIIEESFAVAPPLPSPTAANRSSLVVERLGTATGQAGFASPPAGVDPAFRGAAIGWAQPIQYRFRAQKAGVYTVFFGICEGYHQVPGQRILDLQVEGKTLRTVDVVAEHGHNQPALYALDARDEDGDGWIDLTVAAAEKSRDVNTILNALWIFRASEAPRPSEVLAGQNSKSALAHLSCGDGAASAQPPRHDALLVRVRNPGKTAASFAPILTIESQAPINPDPDRKRVDVGSQTRLFSPAPWAHAEITPNRVILHFGEMTVPPESEKTLTFGVGRGANPPEFPREVSECESARKRAASYWSSLDLPYDHLQVPDSGVQALLDSSIRNIYQAREIKKGLPAFQVGPTCYRGLWVVDGSFLLEAVTFLGRTNETRSGVKYLMSFQRPDGGFMLIDGHWKETGIALWAITRHARLTDDKAWLLEVWPKVERGFAFIGKMRQMPLPGAPNAELIPDGFSDGGLADRVPEYTNIYWTMAGMRAAIEAARWLGRPLQALAWQREYDDFCQTFRRAADRDKRSDPQGNSYVPIRMLDNGKIPPQKAQWAFLHAVFPGQVFSLDDPLVQGNMAMLRAVESQGLVFDTGWLKNGIWNYFASFYAHAWLWLGEGAKAARTLYAFGNHASPLLVWREEQMPVGQGAQVVGDMPHNWASAEFIRLVRHSLALERGEDLHLFEGLPPGWAKPGAAVRLREVLTQFGPLSLDFQVAKNGRSARLHLAPPRRTPPRRILLHLDHWSERNGTLELNVEKTHVWKLDLQASR